MSEADGVIDAAPHEIAHGALRGVIASAAMTGMRQVTHHFGLVEEPPPQAIFRQRARGALKLVPRKRRRGVVELAHWAFGAQAGAMFAVLPDGVRRQPWAGPAFGLVVWAGFEAGIAPALGLKQAKEVRPVERAALAADHLLYGFVLSEMRRRPQD
jgi:hypothetical protein